MTRKAVGAFLALSMVFSLAACGPEDGGGTTPSAVPSAATSDESVYRMSIAHLDPSGPIYEGWEYMKQILEEKSDGRIQVTIYPNKQISNSDTENAEKVQQNIVQMSSVPTSALTSLASIDGYKVLEYPYLFGDNDELNKVLDSELMQELSDELNGKTGIKAYGGFNIGWLRVSNKKGPVSTPADLAGLKIRTMTSDLQMACMNAWGASATPLSFGEVFTALQQGTVDGVMTTSVLHVSERYYEVEKYITCTDAIPNVHIPIVNGDWYDSLPEDLKTVFNECVADYMDNVRALEEAAQDQSLKDLEDNGMTVTTLTAEEKQAFIDATSGILEENKALAGEAVVDRVLELLGK